MATLSQLYSEGIGAVGGGAVYSVVIRKRDDGSYLALCKLAGRDGVNRVCYGAGDTPDVALIRLADAAVKPERWRRDRLDERI